MTESELQHLMKVEMELARFHTNRAKNFGTRIRALRTRRIIVKSQETTREIIEKLKT